MAYYPIFIKLDGKTALVVGGGRVAQRKIETLLEYGASVHIISKKLTDKLKQLVEAGDIRHMGEKFENKHLDRVFLVIAATDDEKLNHDLFTTNFLYSNCWCAAWNTCRNHCDARNG